MDRGPSHTNPDRCVQNIFCLDTYLTTIKVPAQKVKEEQKALWNQLGVTAPSVNHGSGIQIHGLLDAIYTGKGQIWQRQFHCYFCELHETEGKLDSQCYLKGYGDCQHSELGNLPRMRELAIPQQGIYHQHDENNST